MDVDSEEKDILMLYLLYRRYKKHKRRRFWVHPINHERERFGVIPHFPRLFNDLEEFYYYTRMGPETFEELWRLVTSDIRKKDTAFRRAIPTKERLLLTLRFLASGENYKSLHYQFRVGASTIGKIVSETCDAIWQKCHPPDIFKLTKDDFKKVSDDFLRKWNFPNCLGCVESKLIKINCPAPSRCVHGMSREQFLIALQGVSDADGNFLTVEVGDIQQDGDDIFVPRCTTFRKALTGNKLSLPDPVSVDGSEKPLPHVFIAGQTYPLLPALLRPFPKRDINDVQRNFNSRLHHAKQASELAFGEMVAKWAVLQSAINLDPVNASKVVLACCALHNFVRHREARDASGRFHSLREPTNALTGRPSVEAMHVRNQFAELFQKQRISRESPNQRTSPVNVDLEMTES